MSQAAPTTIKPFDPSSNQLGPSLLDDLLALADYYRERGLTGEELTPAEFRFIVALVRYRFAPPESKALTGLAHVMVFGGAGAGKSTTANIISGTNLAEVNAQAGYTRHPVAIHKPRADESAADWPDQLGPLHRRDAGKGDLDEDCYSVVTIQESDGLADPAFLTQHVVWDCPDLTAKDASYYEGRVIEIAALADVCLYVASDERYNDELPTNFLQAVLEAGQQSIVVLTKMSPFDTEEFLQYFQTQVVERLRSAEQIREIYPIPTPLKGKVHELWTDAFPHGAHLRGTIERLTRDLDVHRNEARTRSLSYLSSRKGRLLDPLARDVGEWRLWVEQVRRSTNAAVQRYEREYLQRRTTNDFHDARDAVLAALPLPGRYAYVWQILEYLRVPYRMLKSSARKYTDRSTTGSIDETYLLDRIREQLMDSLTVTVAGRRGRHGFWDALHQSLLQHSNLQMNQVFDELRNRQMIELRTQQRNTYERVDVRLSQSPVQLWSLRVGRIAVDVIAAILAGWTGYQVFGSTLWIVILVLAALGATDDLVRIAIAEYVRRERDELLNKQKENVRQLFRAAYVDELVRLPHGIGDRLQHLSELLERIPRAIASLASRHRPKEPT